ncbi:uncharacterized protein F4812DRAFT_124647 [Daldinia caldariorum]|uniref:uncharacterized protein n=1 Tax=Daldinia caldariorum TaxID=326644 RepID=UPI002008ADFE|nr:uncharacterized protein F4812DRAFT_124647 [Daldinia caldariorum]KAI1465467.1 hypothetical protein F4812DRAFT_124647 [Daldinia caldariorum]
MAKHDYPYKKSINLTAWILQFLVCFVLLGASAWLLWLADQHDYDDVLGEYHGLFTAGAGLQIAIAGSNIVMNIIEIVLIAKKQMPPALFLTSACTKTAVWGVIFILNLISVSILAVILAIILLATSLLQLIHAAIIVHRKRRGTLRGGNYTPALNPSGLEEGIHYPPAGSTEYKSPAASSQPLQYGYPMESGYAPQQQPVGSYELGNRTQHV